MNATGVPELVREYNKLYRPDLLRRGLVSVLRHLARWALVGGALLGLLHLLYIGSVVGWGEIGSLIAVACHFGYVVLGGAVIASVAVLCGETGDVHPAVRIPLIAAALMLVVGPWFYRGHFDFWTYLDVLPSVSADLPPVVSHRKVSPGEMTNLHVLWFSACGLFLLATLLDLKPTERAGRALKIWGLRGRIRRRVAGYQRRMAADGTAPVCMDCLTRCDAPKLPGTGIRYHACRACARIYDGASSWAFHRAILAVVGSPGGGERKTRADDDSVLCIHIVEGQRPFDFDAVVVTDARDGDVERFVMMLNNDTDETRRQRYPKLDVTVSDRRMLSQHSINMLRSHFRDICEGEDVCV